MSNANYAWVMHKIHHLAPNGIAGFVLANGSMSSNQSGEGDIRQSIIDADLVDCMVALPGQLFYNTQIPACLWFLARNKKNGLFRDSPSETLRERTGETLFIDAIADFKSSEADKIILDKTTFSAITSTPGTGFSNVSDFKITSSGATSTAKIIYDAVSGQLFYNQNGCAAGFGSGGLFATLTGATTLNASDFVVQA